MRDRLHDWLVWFGDITVGDSARVKELATQFLLVGTYVAAGKIGLTLALLSPSATAVWPPAGIALAAVLILGARRASPGIFIGAFLVNQITAGSWLTSAAIAFGNTAEALLGAYLFNRVAGRRAAFGRIRTLFLFALLAGLLSTTVSATVGVTALYLAGYATSAAYLSIWVTWWLGDATGALLVAPAILLWHSTPRRQWSRRQRVELLLLALTTVLVAWTVFARTTYPLSFLCIPVCVWAGVRFGQREASTTACVLSAIAVWGTLRGHGALAGASLNTELLWLQAFMATTGMIGLVVGAAVWESQRAAVEARCLSDELEQHVQARTAELQAAHDQLVTTDARLKEAQEVAHIGSWERRVPENLLWWSDEMFRVFGVEAESFVPSREAFMALVHPDDRAAISEANRRCLEHRTPFECEHRIIRPDGHVRTIVSQGHAVQNAVGEVIRVGGTVQDITARKAAEEILSRSERRLQTIIDAEPACVMLASPDGLLSDMNRAGLEMVGAEDVSQLVGRPVIDLVHPDDRNPFLEMHRAASGGSLGKLEFRLVALNGAERLVDSHAVPFDTSTNRSGAPRAVLSVSSDITERKQLEERLRGAQQMEAVGRLAGGVAHDFNNLLTAISGFTELVLLTLEEADPRRADLSEVGKATARAASLTRQLLAFSRRQVLQTRVFDLNTLVCDIEKLLNRTIGEDIELVLALAPALEPVRVDPSQLEQVVLNLAVNARDAMPKGGQLRFVTEMVDVDQAAAQRHAPMPPGRYVRLTVTDTGSGISPEVQQHIFEPFFTTKERNKGTGLGLATVYGIVKQSGGYIWVTSQLELGTSFEIYLPPVQEAVEPLVRVEGFASLTGGTETVLLAEDDGAVRRLVCTTLRHYGYEVLEARDGEEALRVARRDRRRDIHLLITDVVMPGLSGRDLAWQLATERPEMRVLYTTGYAETVTMRTGLERDVPLLSKPFLPNDLIRAVREILDTPPL